MNSEKVIAQALKAIERAREEAVNERVHISHGWLQETHDLLSAWWTENAELVTGGHERKIFELKRLAEAAEKHAIRSDEERDALAARLAKLEQLEAELRGEIEHLTRQNKLFRQTRNTGANDSYQEGIKRGSKQAQDEIKSLRASLDWMREAMERARVDAMTVITNLRENAQGPVVIQSPAVGERLYRAFVALGLYLPPDDEREGVIVVQEGVEDEQWTLRTKCTGNGNGDGGCGAILVVKPMALFRTRSYFAGRETGSHVTFECPSCRCWTDVRDEIPHRFLVAMPERSPSR